MTPFIQDLEQRCNTNDQQEFNAPSGVPSFDFDCISSKSIMSGNDGAIFEDDDDVALSKIKDKKLIFIGLGTSILFLASALIYFLTREKTVDIEELPVIKADYQPIKERIEMPNSVPYEDKKIYTYITAADNCETPKLKEEPAAISIKEVNKSKLTDADKKMILKAFEDLAPNAKRRTRVKVPQQICQPSITKPVVQYQPNQVVLNSRLKKNLRTTENIQPINALTEITPHRAAKKTVSISPITSTSKRIPNKSDAAKRKSDALNYLIREYDSSSTKTAKIQGKTIKVGYNKSILPVTTTSNSDVYVQIASLPSKDEANIEYNRIRNSHTVLRKFSHKIVPVNLGNFTRYRVMIGPFGSKEAANKAVQEMRNNGLRPLW